MNKRINKWKDEHLVVFLLLIIYDVKILFGGKDPYLSTIYYLYTVRTPG